MGGRMRSGGYIYIEKQDRPNCLGDPLFIVREEILVNRCWYDDLCKTRKCRPYRFPTPRLYELSSCRSAGRGAQPSTPTWVASKGTRSSKTNILDDDDKTKWTAPGRVFATCLAVVVIVKFWNVLDRNIYPVNCVQPFRQMHDTVYYT